MVCPIHQASVHLHSALKTSQSLSQGSGEGMSLPSKLQVPEVFLMGGCEVLPQAFPKKQFAVVACLMRKKQVAEVSGPDQGRRQAASRKAGCRHDCT